MSLLPDADERDVIAAYTRGIGASRYGGSRKPGNGAATHTSGPPERPVWHCANSPGRERGTESGPPMTGGPASTASGDSRPRDAPGGRTTCSWPTSGTTARRCRPPSGTATGRDVRAVGAAGSGRARYPSDDSPAEVAEPALLGLGRLDHPRIVVAGVVDGPSDGVGVQVVAGVRPAECLSLRRPALEPG